MVGFYAIADDTKPTRTDLDNELEGIEDLHLSCLYSYKRICVLLDARWYTRDEILEVLGHSTGTTLNPLKPADTATAQEPPFRLPPRTAIAGVLINDWAHRKFVITGPDARSSL